MNRSGTDGTAATSGATTVPARGDGNRGAAARRFAPSELRRMIVERITQSRSRSLADATTRDKLVALALTTRYALADRWTATQASYHAQEQPPKRGYYLSAEYLPGRMLVQNLLALGCLDELRGVVAELGFEWSPTIEAEPEAALGNGGLGRLASCLLDSWATLDMPVYGYGIRYNFGLFRQAIEDGYQRELAEDWLALANSWEIERPEYGTAVSFYGRSEGYTDEDGVWRVRWADAQAVWGMPYDTPVAGFGTHTVNTLRLWSARAVHELDFAPFNRGDYVHAVEERDRSELLSKVLYPSDDTPPGKELRLKQEYFLVACAVHDIIRRHLADGQPLSALADKTAIQINDTHPALVVVELMRVLVDVHRVPWEEAWKTTVAVCSYTNHTLLTEALERWPVPLFERVLPRHLDIVYEINRRLLDDVRARFPGDDARLGAVSLIEEGSQKQVRMAALATVGAHAVNGVSPLHSALLRTTVLKPWAELYPDKICNITNGVTPRRWLLATNPNLSDVLTEAVGEDWPRDLDRLAALRTQVNDARLLDDVGQAKASNKRALAVWAKTFYADALDTNALYDVQAKRFHEYKRQLLKALHCLVLYRRALEKRLDVPRVVWFAGKAAPGYLRAKLIIKLVTSISELVRQNAPGRGLAVVFVPDYGVAAAERLIAAADLSEQISTAGTEASGTSNMKLALNGALTIGTLDGANIDLREAVGHPHFFEFGRTAEELAALRAQPRPARDRVALPDDLQAALELLESGLLPSNPRDLFAPLVHDLLTDDRFFVGEDFVPYIARQADVDALYRQPKAWRAAALHNIAGGGFFSSDRTAREYATRVWGLVPQRRRAR